MEYDLLAVLPLLEHEDIEARTEALLVAFERTHPEAGAATSANLVTRTFDVLFTVEADDAFAAIETGKHMFVGAAEAAGIIPRALVGLHVDRVADQEAVPA